MIATMIQILNSIVMVDYQYSIDGIPITPNRYRRRRRILKDVHFLLQFFREVWSTSCPVLVKRVHLNLSKTLWQPNAFKEHMIDHRETPALWDCETLTPILTNEELLTKFWDGFERLNGRKE